MSEFIREVDEEYRQDQIRRVLNKHWGLVLAALLAVLVGVGAWRGYVYWHQQQAEAAGIRYFDATERSRGDRSGSLAALDALAKDGPFGYRLLARFRAAGQTGQENAAAGAAAFDSLADDASLEPELREVARLRAAMLLVDTADPAELRRRLEPLADANGTFRNAAREMLGVAALKAGNDADAGRWFDAIVSDPIAAADQRQRAGLFLSLVRAGKPAPKP